MILLSRSHCASVTYGDVPRLSDCSISWSRWDAPNLEMFHTGRTKEGCPENGCHQRQKERVLYDLDKIVMGLVQDCVCGCVLCGRRCEKWELLFLCSLRQLGNIVSGITLFWGVFLFMISKISKSLNNFYYYINHDLHCKIIMYTYMIVCTFTYINKKGALYIKYWIMKTWELLSTGFVCWMWYLFDYWDGIYKNVVLLME